jgi:hypothetical protein
VTSKEKLSPERVLRRAFWTIKVPSIATMVLVPVIIVFVLQTVAQNHPDAETTDPIWVYLILFLIFAGFGAGWLVWSVRTPKWRLWAYTRVADIDTLKKLAVQRGYIWPPGHFFEKTEIASRTLRLEIKKAESGRASLGGS